MTVDKFGLGDWWPRPDQAAAGGLDHLGRRQWPMLAAKWLAAGFDSPSLRQLARFQTVETRPLTVETMVRAREAKAALADLMREALRSIGFDPAPADEEFTARCQRALDLVQHDLDVTGYGRYRMRARIQEWPARVFPTLPDGSYWGGSEGMGRQLAGSFLLYVAAVLVSGTIKEVPEVEWPVCAVHGGHPETDVWDGEESVDLIDGVPWWRCTNTGHALAPVGQLTAKIAKRHEQSPGTPAGAEDV